MKRQFRAAIGLAASLVLGAGCGTDATTSTPGKASGSVEAGPNKRLKFKDEYKQALGKDGRPLWKPGSTKLPPGVPKS